MENEQKTETKTSDFWITCQIIGYTVLMVILSYAVCTVYNLNRDRSEFDRNRQKCNATVLHSPRDLSENSDHTFFEFGATTTADQVDHKLNATNKEVNDLKALIACYFDP